MSKFSKAVKRMNDAEKNLKGAYLLSPDPKTAHLEKKLLDAQERVRKEGLNG